MPGRPASHGGGGATGRFLAQTWTTVSLSRAGQHCSCNRFARCASCDFPCTRWTRSPGSHREAVPVSSRGTHVQKTCGWSFQQMFAAVHPHFLPRKNHALVRGASAGHSGDQALGGPLLCSGACSRRCFSIQNITTGSCWPRCRCQRDGKVRSVCRQCAVCRACERCISESEHLQRQFTQVLAPALKVFPWTGLWDATSAFEASLPPPGCLPSPGSGRSL